MITAFIVSCVHAQTYKPEIITYIGEKEYAVQMKLSLDDFDQSDQGFRKYSANYELICLLIPEYIEVNDLSGFEAGNLHWHLGQMHAFHDNVEEAITEMELSYLEGMPIFWKCYVDGSVAFLQRDKAKLLSAFELLKKQDNQMNLDVLERLIANYEESYWEAYNGIE
jgi:hypothetical protein